MRVKITIEGKQGSGKTTVAQIIKKALIAAGYSAIVFDEVWEDDPPLTSAKLPDATIITRLTK